MLHRKTKIGIGLILLLGVLLTMFFWSNKEETVQKDTPLDHDLALSDLKNILLLPEEHSEIEVKPGQIIQVSGYVKEVNLLNERITLLLKGEQDTGPYMICDLQSDQKQRIDQLQTNDFVKVKGVFKGFLKDAIFLHCIITDLPSHE